MLSPATTNVTLALDLGATTGWAVAGNGVIMASGSRYFPYNSDDGHAGEGRRFADFHNWLRDKIVDFQVDEIVYEYVAGWQSSNAAKALYYGLRAQMCIVGQHVSPIPIKTNELKLAFTGSGNASKEAMCAKCMQLGWENGVPGEDKNHDEADAVALMFTHRKWRQRECRFATDEEKIEWLHSTPRPNGT